MNNLRFTENLKSAVTGNTVERYSFDAWGRRRNPQTLSYDNVTASFDRGFTGHEHLYNFGLINMNGRVYDPFMSTFLSPDNYIQAPDNSQNFNRYAYCLNNPLKYTDPSGEIFWAPIILGATIGAYMGGTIANNDYNPLQWNYDSGKTWGYMLGGAIVGGISGYVGGAIAASEIPMANTVSIAASSFTYSTGTWFYTGGQTPISISFGVASYDIINGTWGYLGKKGNKWYENLGYGLGALANASDLLIGFKPQKIDLVTEHSDAIGHSAIVEHGSTSEIYGTGNPAYADPNGIISVGPNRYTDPYGNWHWMKGTNYWNTHTSQSDIIWRQSLYVNKSTIVNYGQWLNKLSDAGKLVYSVELSSCVTHTSLALNLSGLFNIGIHPYILHAQMYLWGNGIRPWFFNYFLNH